MPDDATGYAAIAAELRAGIDSGYYQPGAELPSAKDLMNRYRVSRVTARRALDLLVRQRLAVIVPSYGPQVRRERAKEAVAVPRGARVWTRPPRGDEWARLGIDPGEPCDVFVVEIGGRERVYASDRTMLTFS